MSSLSLIRKAHPGALIILSFIGLILIGTILLKLPFSTVSKKIDFIDALFTSTSAVCVTGLVVVDTGTFFSTVGKTVIITLIQIGGLGVMTVSVMIFYLVGKSISIRQRFIIQDLFSQAPRGDILNLLRSILIFTLLVEFSGSLLLFFHWIREFSILKAAYLSIFHSISAFCNAGFSLFSNSGMNYSASPLFNITMCSLIVLGGIGFPVIYDIYQKRFLHRGERNKLSVQTKTVLITTSSLIVIGALLFWILEYDLILKGRGFLEKIMVSLFQSITCRTAGFNTVDISMLSAPTLTLMMFLMFFGASPGSCGGGVKTTTLALLISFGISRLKGGSRVNMFKKSIPMETVQKSLSLVIISLVIILIIFFILLTQIPHYKITYNNQHNFLPLLFETISAFGTVGLSMGVTAKLNFIDKIFIILLMLIGRVGVLTFAYTLLEAGPKKKIEYAEENIMIG